MFFTNHRSNTEAGHNVNVDYLRDGTVSVQVYIPAKGTDLAHLFFKIFDDEESAIQWAVENNYIVAM